MNQAHPPYNPYVPYGMPVIASVIDTTGHRPHLRVWFLIVGACSSILYLLGLAGIVAAVVVHDHDLAAILMMSAWAALMLGAALIYVKLGLGIYWLHGAWKWVPMDQRYGRDGKRIAPGDVFMLLIPYYNLYWMFPINLALCDIMERLRAAYVREGRVDLPPRDTAMWAAICEIVPFANFFVAPFFWGSYMRRIDVMHDEISNALAGRAR